MPLNAEILKAHPNPAFVETGTYLGEGVEAALAAGFDRVWTVDLDEGRQAAAASSYANTPQVVCASGDSALFLSRLTLETSATFWLDAHPVGYFELLQPDLPLVNELLALGFTPRDPRDIILIDDIRLFGEEDRKRLERLVRLLWPGCEIDLIDSSIIPRDILRVRRLCDSHKDANGACQVPFPVLKNPLASMNAAIFIKSYARDFPWLVHCLRSIQKFASGFSEIVIVIPDTDNLDCLTAERVVRIKEPPGDGYMFQQSVKMHADTWTDADMICFVDSDCVFTAPVTPETFMTGGSVNWLYTPWEALGECVALEWRAVVERCVGESPPYEFMRRHPFMIPRWALQEFRGFVSEKHGVSLEHYIVSQQNRLFTEFNCIGFYLWLHHHEKINWMNTEDYLPPAVLRQFWSHGGITDEMLNELESSTQQTP